MKDILRYVALAGIFALPFLSLVVSNSLFFPFITGKNFLFRIIVEVVFAAWVLLSFYEPKYRPRFSYILIALIAWIGIIFTADVTGLNPLKSLWSNYERMEGFVAIFHVALYVMAVGHMINTEKLWNYLLNTTLGAAFLVVLYAFAQLGGKTQIDQGGARIDATLGNAAYFAIYMLFHVGIAAFMAARAKSRNAKIVYSVLSLVFAGLLIASATRGTVLGLIFGSGIALVYITLFSRGAVLIRKIGIGALVVLLVCVSVFISARHSTFVQNNDTLARIASISLGAGDARFVIWNMALQGVKERPLLGWGQENFNYVFNKYYDPRLHGEEPWFDRVHDIFFDWLIAGGIFGFLSYFAIFFTTLYYVAVAPRIRAWKGTVPIAEPFTVLEQAILLGLLAGYMLHNVFVFDNIISYMFYGTILALVHARVASSVPWKSDVFVSKYVLDNAVAPVIGVALVIVVYFVNFPALFAASDIIQGFQEKTPDGRLASFDRALGRNGFGNQEIREQLTRITQEALQQQKLPEDIKKKFKDRTEKELTKQLAETPNDARIRVFAASFYRTTGQPKRASEELEKALALSPRKQQIMFEQGLAYLQQGDAAHMLERFKAAFDLAPKYINARMFYAGAALYAQKPDVFAQLITNEYKDSYYQNDFILRAAYDTKHFDIVQDISKHKSDAAPGDLQLRVSLAVAYYQGGNTPSAIAVLQKATQDFPDFKTQGDQYIKAIQEGKVPKN